MSSVVLMVHKRRGKDCPWMMLSPAMVADRSRLRKDRCKKNHERISSLVALVPSCFLLKVKRSGFQEFSHFFGPLKLLQSCLVVFVKETSWKQHL